ncbi:hypothetical protein ACWN8V_02035 [Vagococcus elongatus]|uniref:hypothetical protein n=1 Tax=Vagococcus elongatus TaxID=180344 RepID=UPI001476D903|nr:hypothetical protein [Vagococcus elongatus]
MKNGISTLCIGVDFQQSTKDLKLLLVVVLDVHDYETLDGEAVLNDSLSLLK